MNRTIYKNTFIKSKFVFFAISFVNPIDIKDDNPRTIIIRPAVDLTDHFDISSFNGISEFFIFFPLFIWIFLNPNYNNGPRA
jgi:hypothetical protein